MSAAVMERRQLSRRLEDTKRCRGLVVGALLAASMTSGAVGFIIGAWFGWCLN